MERRTLLKSLVGGLVALVGGWKLWEKKASSITVKDLTDVGTSREPVFEVQVLDHYAKEREYKTYKTFDTEEAAHEWVRSLIPQLHWIGYRRDTSNVDEMLVEIVSQPTLTFPKPGVYEIGLGPCKREFTDCGMAKGWFYSIADAWMFISNIRVDGELVRLASPGSNLSPLITQPFRKSGYIVEDITPKRPLVARDRMVEQETFSVRSGYRNAVRAQFRVPVEGRQQEKE